MSRPRTVLAATLLAVTTLAATTLLAVATAGQAGAAPSSPTPTPSTSPQPPSTPTDLRVTAVTSRSVTLAWTAATPGCCAIAGYDVTWNQAFNDVFWLQDAGNVTTVTITSSIQPTGQYSFRVAARDTLGHRSPSSNSVSVVTPLSDTAADVTPPSAPGGLQVTGTSTAGAALAWTASTDDVAVTGYNVYRFDGLYVSTLVGTATGTSFVAPTVTPRDIFYVRARDAAGNLSAGSNTVTVPIVTTTPTPPPAPTCTASYRTTAQWTGGFVAEVTIASTTAVTGWVLAFRFGGDQRITNVWNATYSQTGADVTLTAATWNRAIPAGGSASAGLLGGWTASPAPPTQATLNGSACTVS